MRTPHVFLTEDDFTRLMALQPHPLLRAELERAIVLAPDAMPAGVVTMNSRVRYVDEHSGTCREIELVYPEEADIADGKVSVLAPVGAALLGLETGKAIDWKFPAGEMRRLRVERVLAARRSRREAATARPSGA